MHPAPDLYVTKLCTWPEVKELRTSWEQLAANEENGSIFATWQWNESWWEVYGQNHRLYVLAVRNGDGVISGIAPFYLARRSIGPAITLQTLVLIGSNEDSGILDILALPGEKQKVWNAVLEFLGRSSDWDILQLSNLDGKLESLELVEQQLEKRGWLKDRFQVARARIHLPANHEEFLARLSPRFRKLLARGERRLRVQFEIEFRRCNSSNDVTDFLERLFNLHSRRWASKGLNGAFNEERRRFYCKISERALAAGWLDLWELIIDGRTVATEYGFEYRGSRYALQSGYEPDFAEFEVGRLLESFLIRTAIERGNRYYDLMLGSQMYKLRWGAEREWAVNLKCAKPWSIGGMALRTNRLLKRAASANEIGEIT